MDIDFDWDAYPDQSFDGFRIYFSPTLEGFTMLKEIPDITAVGGTVQAPGFGAFNYQLRTYKGELESPGSDNVPVEFQIQAPTGFRRRVVL